MKILIYSDLHVDFGNPDITIPDVDIIVLAGDIGQGKNGVKWIKNNIKDIPVVYVLGNHEYYSNKYPRLLTKLKEEVKDTNIFILENEKKDFNNVRFLGATLWTDYRIMGKADIAGYECEQVMNDFKKIRIEPTYRKIKYSDLSIIHRKSVDWFCRNLSDSSDKINIVVTHHLPSIISLPPKRRQEWLAAAYASDLEEIIIKYKPHFWIHGHVHSSSDYQIENTRIINNPYGYTDKRNADFKNDMIIEVF